MPGERTTSRSARSRQAWLALVAGCTCALGIGAALLHDDGRLAAGVSIGGVPVGGLSTDQAKAALKAVYESQLPPQVTLSLDTRTWVMDNQRLSRRVDYAGAVGRAFRLTRTGSLLLRARTRLRLAHQGVDVPIKVVLDTQKLAARLKLLAAEVNTEPQNAKVVNYKGGQIEATQAVDGQTLEIDRTVAAVLADGVLPAPDQVPAVVTTKAAKVNYAALHDSLNTVLARYSTNMWRHYGSPMRENRRQNVELCLKRFRGTVLAPGEVFSFNDRVGERRAEDGFRESIIFKRQPDGSVEEEWETAGGICQLASTLFNAALLANLTITERGNHSKVVLYVPVARDATVYYGRADLKFANTLDHPIMVWGELDGWDLVLTIVGEASDRYDVSLNAKAWKSDKGDHGSLSRTVKRPTGEVVKANEFICNSFYPGGRADDASKKPSPKPPAPKPPVKSVVEDDEQTKTAPDEN